MTEALHSSNIWSKDSFHTKAIRYLDVMLSFNRDDDWQFGFWSALALEMIAKAALSNISPVLIADGKNINSIYYALGKVKKTENLTAISISEVFNRLQFLLKEKFTENEFCIQRMQKRNSEVHSGELAFDNRKASQWLPQYYVAISELLYSYGETLESTLGTEEAETAKILIESHKDDTKNSILGEIAKHKKEWNAKFPDEQEILRQQARITSTRHLGHRVACPSCNCQALLHGKVIGSPIEKIEENLIIVKQDMLPTSFECIACGLKISGYSKLSVCGLGDTFVSTTQHDPTEYFDIDPSSFFEEDFNEY